MVAEKMKMASCAENEREAMSIDRFNSNEDIEWAKGSFDDGAEARIFGYGKDQCPGAETIGEFARRSWLAGFADADMTIASEGIEPKERR